MAYIYLMPEPGPARPQLRPHRPPQLLRLPPPFLPARPVCQLGCTQQKIFMPTSTPFIKLSKSSKLLILHLFNKRELVVERRGLVRLCGVWDGGGGHSKSNETEGRPFQ